MGSNLPSSGGVCHPRILKAYNDSEFTDLTITCGPLTFEVHRVVVAGGSACDFFAKALSFAGKETEEKNIHLPDDDPDMIRRLITYLYLGDYDPCNGHLIRTLNKVKQYESTTAAASAYHSRKGTFGNTESSKSCACLTPYTNNVEQPMAQPEAKAKPAGLSASKAPLAIEVARPLTIHATMYALADKYQVDGLGQLAKDKFESCLYHHANSEDFVDAVQIAYSSTPETNRGLRDVVVKAFRVHFQIKIEDVLGLEDKLDSIDELSFLLIKSWPNKMEQAKPVPTAPSVAVTNPGAPTPATANTRTTSVFGASTVNPVNFGRPISASNTRTASLFGSSSAGTSAVTGGGTTATASGNGTTSALFGGSTSSSPQPALVVSPFSSAPPHAASGFGSGVPGAAQESPRFHGFGGTR
ncbi:hypothetical protein BDW02DRAFT_574738 [Decorospora gaudefroyi]|uniref:BTB domain-containing protein n=1 Tax=Decorospora gaudefroyi TaxID=184978 RepID=A0A6A5K230_9PLEO|nr:hypothetical protein BDW02DRAFT_574738 [Decorospora gaudefroyi]